MKVAGFTIIKNAVVNDFPIVEAIRSVLPVVDEMIVLIGDSTDETIALIESIGDPKIKIHHSVWNKNLRKGGAVLADETNKAFAFIDPACTWAFYIQGDEVVHEKYHPAIRAAYEKYADDQAVQGLLFKYKHFYGTYDYVGDSRKWYAHEIRIIRNNKAISAYRDAQGFRIGNTKLPVAAIDASIYHYGWVKSPEQMRKKQKESSVFWNDDTQMEKIKASPDYYDFSGFDSLEKFTETHPNVMLERIERKNWSIELDLSKKKFSLKNLCLYYFEKWTGIRPFDFKNYKIIRS
jgi:glycosyltransferase involved in cell wall biosynthesis